MWIKKIRKNRLQFLMIGAILCLTAVIFSACLIFTVEISRYSTDYYSRAHFPDVLLIVKSGDAKRQILNTPDARRSIAAIDALPGRAIDGNIHVGRQTIAKGFTQFWAITDFRKLPWQVTITAGRRTPAPATGDIWIGKIYADMHGIHVGDKLRAGGRTFRVSALVNAATCPSATIGIYPFYLNAKDVRAMPSQAACSLIAVRFKQTATNSSDWISQLPVSVTTRTLTTLPRSTFLFALSEVSQIPGGAGLIAACVIFAVSLVIIRFVLKSSLTKEYKSIGIYKATGMTVRQIRGFYLKGYAFVGALAIGLGLCAGVPLGALLGRLGTSYTGSFSLTWISPLLALTGGGLLFLLLVSGVRLTLGSIGRISPVAALRIGMTSSKAKLRRALLPHAGSALATAVNDIFRRRALSLITVLMLTVSFFLMLLFYFIDFSISHMEPEADVWFAAPRHDVSIDLNVSPKLRRTLNHSSYVKSYVYGGLTGDAVVTAPENRKAFANCVVFNLNRFDDAQLRIPYIKGRAPRLLSEIALSTKQLALAGKQVGDYIPLTIAGKRADYLIVGSYSSMLGGGTSMELRSQQLTNNGQQPSERYTFVKLRRGSDTPAFRKEIMTRFLEASVAFLPSTYSDAANGVANTITPVTRLLIAIFALFSLMNVVTLLFMNQLERRRQVGIMKAYGFTSGYICRQNLARIGLLALTGACLALVLHTAMSTAIFSSMIGLNPGLNPLPTSLAVIAAVLVPIMLITIAFSLPVRHVSPTELIDE